MISVIQESLNDFSNFSNLVKLKAFVVWVGFVY